ncbi:UNVERIFIED_CONTAM: hypothetical protein H355_015967 [Colinus virginianus]|nr:hypothetical protein H355_015967 [Colinus virginianus]
MFQAKLIITGDDFGYCPRRNRGIVECFLARAVSNVSLLVNGSAAAEAAELARRLNVKQELKAQVDLFHELTGHLPPHMDGHQHVHVLPEVRNVFAEVLEEYGIKYTRVPIEPGLHNCDWIEPSLMDFYLGVEKDSLNTVDVFTKHGIRWTDVYIGLSTMGKNMSVSAVQNAIDAAIVEVTSRGPTHPLPQHGAVTMELMVHPGYPSVPPVGGCGAGPDPFSQSWERLHELHTLMEPELQSHYRARNIQLCSFQDL